MNWKETHTDIQCTIEAKVTNGVLFHDCEYVTRWPEDPENGLSLQIHLGLLKRRTVGLDGEEKLILDGLERMGREISYTGVGGSLEFAGVEAIEAALEKFVDSRVDFDHTPIGLMYRSRRALAGLGFSHLQR